LVEGVKRKRGYGERRTSSDESERVKSDFTGPFFPKKSACAPSEWFLAVRLFDAELLDVVRRQTPALKMMNKEARRSEA
jgi:hypothetical protein